jgi:hypothetical protein
MRTKFNGILTLLLALMVQLALAQEQTVTGTVSDESGLPLPGASVVIKGTNTGVSTNFDGQYTIKASKGQTLVFSYVGYGQKEVAVGASNKIDISLDPSDNQLEEVIITAQGIKKEKKALGYAVTTVTSEDLEQKADTDIGKV